MANANYTAEIQEKTPSVKQVEKAVTLAMQNSGGGGGGGIETWTTGTSYAVGTYVTYNNDLYLCLTAHTAGTFATDAANWKMVGAMEDAPSDGDTYGRADGEWVSLVGPQGPQGTPGTDGNDGEDGKSAYQSAVDAGFTGTEAQFTALLLNWLTDAPNDNNVYVRVNGAWAVVSNATVTSA